MGSVTMLTLRGKDALHCFLSWVLSFPIKIDRKTRRRHPQIPMCCGGLEPAKRNQTTFPFPPIPQIPIYSFHFSLFLGPEREGRTETMESITSKKENKGNATLKIISRLQLNKYF